MYDYPCCLQTLLQAKTLLFLLYYTKVTTHAGNGPFVLVDGIRGMRQYTCIQAFVTPYIASDEWMVVNYESEGTQKEQTVV